MKKAFLFVALASAMAFAGCNGNPQKIGEGDATTEITITDSVSTPNAE